MTSRVILNGQFHVMDYSLSHKILLLRATDDVGLLNQDVFFISTIYMEIPTIINNMEIYTGSKEDIKHVAIRCGERSIKGYSVFVIISGNSKYYICAMRLEIKENNLDPLETSIGIKK
jgi:hypothetical protein